MDLLERSNETDAIAAALDAAVDGQGRLLLIEGEAGVGKSSLLNLATEKAGERRVVALSARGGEYEREFPYGVIRQLFGGRVGEVGLESLSGASALAAPVFDVTAEGAGADRVAIQHGLHWLAADLAAEAPLALIVDDVQWADVASLHALIYLARRLEELPVVLLVAIRTGEPDVPEELLDALYREPAAEILSPRPLSPEAAGELSRCELDSGEPTDRFLGACYRASGGNPFLLLELLRALSAEGVALNDANADRVAELASAGVARSVLLRLHGLGDDAIDVARAVAVLEPNAEPEHVAALAGLSVAESAAPCERLVRAHVLTGERPLGFVHPLVRQAVYGDISATRRAILHFEAARLLSASGAATDSAAAHLLLSPPAGEGWIVVALRQAAREALARGAPEAASEYLRRALAEPPGDAELWEIREQLGVALLEAANPDGMEELLAVRSQSSDPVHRARIARHLVDSLSLRGRVDEGMAMIAESIEEVGDADPDLAAHLAGMRVAFSAIAGIPVAREELLSAVERVGSETLGERHLRNMAALALASGAGRADEAISTAAWITRDPDAAARDNRGGFLRAHTLLALALADRTEDAIRLIDDQITAARSRGAPSSAGIATHYRAQIHWLRGELAEAQADAEFAERLLCQIGIVGGIRWHAAATVVRVLTDRGELESAQEMLSSQALGAELPPGFLVAILLCARADLRRALGDPEGARADYLAAARRTEWARYPHPGILGWRPGLALSELALGRRAEALAAAEKAVEVAREAGSAYGIGHTLRVQGVVAGAEGIPLLRESVATLAETTARLEHARCLVELGAALRRANDRRAAREPLREGLELAHRSGARPLEERARVELAASGARPRKEVRSGVEALTPSELRVARLAASGKTNREIAQELFVTVKTVEFHLRHCYQKLDIERRNELATALG